MKETNELSQEVPHFKVELEKNMKEYNLYSFFELLPPEKNIHEITDWCGRDATPTIKSYDYVENPLNFMNSLL